MLYGRIIGVVTVMVIGAALIVGCGDDGEASSGITKAEFIKEAEAVCDERREETLATSKAYNQERKEKGPFTNKEGVERSEAIVDSKYVPIMKNELAAFEDLEVPEGDEAEIEKMLQSRSRAIEEIEEGGVAVFVGNPFKDFEKEAKAYGLNCAPLY